MSLLIADSGSTKTDWRLVESDGASVQVITNGLNPYYQTTSDIVAVLQTQLLPSLPVPANVSAVYFYGAGCSGPSVNDIVADALGTVLPNHVSIMVNSDMLGAARGACGHEPGIICILGTGSNACCYNGQDVVRSIQSLGFWLGDEGSGGYLGKTLVRDFFQNRLPADLRAAFAHRYALDRPTLLENAYRQPFPNRYFAAFAPFLSEHIQSAYATETVTTAFRLFLETYIRPFPESAEWPVHVVGSVAAAFADFLTMAVQGAGFRMGHILKAPAEGLMAYHR